MRPPDQELLEYLQNVTESRRQGGRKPWGGGYLCIEDFVLQRGEVFIPQARPPQFRQRRPRSCFYNSLLEAQRSPRLRYVEGYALGVIPVLHGWCVDEQHRVIDVTWPLVEDDRPVIEDEHGRPEYLRPQDVAYRGVVMPTPFVTRATTGNWCCVIDDWQSRWPLLQVPGFGEPGYWDRVLEFQTTQRAARREDVRRAG